VAYDQIEVAAAAALDEDAGVDLVAGLPGRVDVRRAAGGAGAGRCDGGRSGDQRLVAARTAASVDLRDIWRLLAQ